MISSLMCGCISSPESETEEESDEIVLPTSITTPSPPKPTATQPLKAKPLNVIEHMIAQIGSEKAEFVFIVENPNKNLALERNQYQIVFYDEAGKQFKESSGTIAVVLPGEQQYVIHSRRLFSSDQVKVAKFEVQINPGEAKEVGSTSYPFTAEQVECLHGPYEYIVTGVIKSSLNKTVKNVPVVAIGYDTSGTFICSGIESIGFVPANGHAAVEISLGAIEEPAKVELYPTLSDLTVFEEDIISLDTFKPEAIWFTQEDSSIDYAFTFENPNKTHSLEGTMCQIAAYDEAGMVQGTHSHYFPIIYPSQRLGVLDRIWNLPEGVNIAKLDIKINTERLNLSKSIYPFMTEQVNYFPGRTQSKVTGIIRNSLEMDVKNIMVMAIAYDKDGTIIGVSEIFVNFILANGYAAVSTNMDITEEPVKVELYPHLSTLSETKEPSTKEATLNVRATGHTLETGRIRIAFIVENTNATHTFMYTDYQTAAYDEAGTVLGDCSQSIAAVFPGEQVGVVNWLVMPETTEVAKIDVQIRPDKAIISELSGNPLTAEQVKYVPDEYLPTVTGLIKSSWWKEGRITLTAIAYDKDGTIIGGGFENGYAEAYGQGLMSVIIDTTGQPQPAKVELYPCLLHPPNVWELH